MHAALKRTHTHELSNLNLHNVIEANNNACALIAFYLLWRDVSAKLVLLCVFIHDLCVRRRIFNYARIHPSCLPSVRTHREKKKRAAAAVVMCHNTWYKWQPIYVVLVPSVLTPKALNRFRRGWRSCLFKNTSDFGRGGFLGRIITRVSSLISSSSNLLSDETDNWRWTRSWSLTPDQSEIG